MNAPSTTPASRPAAPAVLPSVEDPDFKARVAIDGGVFDVILTGNADLNVKKQLDAFLATVHALALEQLAPLVQVDVRSLEFMNSSCLKGLVSWISWVNGAPSDRQYRIVFLAKTGSRWQRRSLYALSCVASHLVSIQD